MNQKIILKIEGDGGLILGELVIGARYNGNIFLRDSENIEPFNYNNATLYNIQKTRTPGDSIPIEFLEKTTEHMEKGIMLLEETDYQILFRSNYDIDEEKGDRVLTELSHGCHDGTIIIDRWLLDEDKRNYRGVLNFSSFVGKSFFDVRINGVNSKRIPFEVRSKKIGYQDQYPAMIGEISELCSGLILDKSAPLFQELQFSEKSRTIHYEDYMFLEYVFEPDHLPLAYEMIRRNPYKRLRRVDEEVPSTFVNNIDTTCLMDIASGRGEYTSVHPDVAKKQQLNYEVLPTFLIQRSSCDDLDIPENKLVLDLLLSLDLIIDRLLETPNIIENGYSRDRLIQFKDTVQFYLSDEWLSDIGSLQYIPMNSQVLQKKEGYREILHYHLSLDLSFRFRWKELEDNIRGYNRKLSQLYEFWCYLQLIKVLSTLSNTQIKYDDLFYKTDDGWSISLKKGLKSVKNFLIMLDDHEINISLMYNRTFSRQKGFDGFNSYTFAFRPDYTLCIESNQKRFLIHFDAKYRSDKEESRTIEAEEETRVINRTYWEDDVCKMHTYKDAILKTEGAYILYPGGGVIDIFRIEEGKEIPSVGALSLTPGRSESESKKLEWFILSILSKNKEKIM